MGKTRNFEKNQRVVVISDCQTTGEHGMILDKYSSYYGKQYVTVLLDCGFKRKYNTLSIELENKYIEKEVNKNMILGENYKVAMVKFLQGYECNKYRQFALFNEAKEGDYVLCDNKDGYTLGIIGEVMTYEEAKSKSKIPTKEIICVCDMSEFNDRKTKREKALKIKTEMDKRIKELQTSQVYEMFAEKDDTLKALLNEYKSL